jgi:glucosamine kinase
VEIRASSGGRCAAIIFIGSGATDLGIDAGGTHTRARLVTSDGQIVGTGEGGPANTRIGLPEAMQSVADAYMQALAAAGLGEGDLSSIRAGSASPG